MMTSYNGTMTSRVGDADLEGAGWRRLDLWEKSTADFRFQSKVRPTHATLRLPPRREAGEGAEVERRGPASRRDFGQSPGINLRPGRQTRTDNFAPDFGHRFNVCSGEEAVGGGIHLRSREACIQSRGTGGPGLQDSREGHRRA